METLNVFLLGRLAGTLTYNGKELAFQYDRGYLADRSSAPLSLSLPLREAPFDAQTTTAFFENLLPPDQVRKKLGKILHLSRHNIFGFLKTIGGDCAGAVSLYPPEHSVSESENELPHLRELSPDETIQILTELPKRPLNLGNEAGFRISGTGAQDKLIACVRDGKVFLPLYGAPSTHIIKPPIKEYPNSVFNELFCMKLAEKIGIPVPSCTLLTFAGIPYYCVTRFDRAFDNGGVSRLHQEDFCQALSIDPEKKYEAEGGPGIAACFQLIREKRLGSTGQLDFIRRIIYNILIGNGDAHAKNFSILFHGREATLAPAYDLLCTEVYPQLSHEAAMSIGGNSDFEKISRQSFIQMAHDCQISPVLVEKQIDEIVDAVTKHSVLLENELNTVHPSPIYAEIRRVIQRRTAALAVLPNGCAGEAGSYQQEKSRSL